MTRFDSTVLLHDREHREVMLRIAAAALDAVNPVSAVARAVTLDGDNVRVASGSVDLREFERVMILGFGKASVGMARGILPLVERLPVTGVLLTNSIEPVDPLEVLEGAHPVPDDRSEHAGRRILETARSATDRDLVVVLISGGGSSLLAAPAPGLRLDDLQSTYELLLRSGAPIPEVNVVRKHLSAVKGGRLGEALAGAGAILTLVISDVVGNPLDAVASGPTVPDPTTYEQALDVLERHGVAGDVPAAVVAHLRHGADGGIAETPTGGEVFQHQVIEIVADAGLAASAAARAAAAEGIAASVTTTRLEGEAREVAPRLLSDAADLKAGEMLVYAGETTVTVTGDGMGGRNQELALAASVELAGRHDLMVLSLGTDGIDGETTAAGAFGDGSAVARGVALGLDARDHLDRNDSSPFLSAVGDTVTCGSTGTNVGDLILVWRLAEAS